MLISNDSVCASTGSCLSIPEVWGHEETGCDMESSNGLSVHSAR